jgi:hypothetical protein
MGEQMFIMKSEVVGWPSVVSDDLVESVDQKIHERRRFTISEFSCEFPQISRTVLYKIVTVRLGYHKFCTRWGQKMHKTQSVASTFVDLFRAVTLRWQ